MMVGAGLVLAWIFILGRGGQYIIRIDYAWGGEFLDGAEVVINDSVVGTLQPYAGGQRVTGFQVEAGEYEVLVRNEDCEGIPKTVSLSSKESRRAVLMADIDDGYRCRIRLW